MCKFVNHPRALACEACLAGTVKKRKATNLDEERCCNTCTFSNVADAQLCEICRTPFDRVSEQPVMAGGASGAKRGATDICGTTLQEFAACFDVAVFDLDSTLWEGNCEHLQPPFALDRPTGCHAVDSRGRGLTLFPEVPALLERLHALGLRIGIASFCGAERTAIGLLKTFQVMPLVQPDLVHIRGAGGRSKVSSKAGHLTMIREDSGAECFRRIAFFDDLLSNIKAAQKLGVVAVRVGPEGLCSRHFARATRDARSAAGSREVMAAFVGRSLAGGAGPAQ